MQHVWILVPQLGMELVPPAVEEGVLTNGRSGKSLIYSSNRMCREKNVRIRRKHNTKQGEILNCHPYQNLRSNLLSMQITWNTSDL